MPDPMDDPLGLPPLDLGESMSMGGQPPASAPQSARARMKDFAPLLALLPIAMAKGGRAGVAALLQGYSQSRQQNQQTERQGQLDAERQRQTAESERMRRATLAQTTANNAATRRQSVLTSFQSGLEGLDNEEAVRAYLQLYGQQAQSVGLRPEVLEGFAMEAVTPSRLQKKEATKALAEAKKTYGEQAVSHTYALRDGTQANWEELNRRAGVGLGVNPASAFEANTPEKMRIAALAKQLGKTPEQLTLDEINKATQNPPDPVLNEIRTLTLANLQNQAKSGALTPAQFSQAQSLANDFQQETKEFWIQRSAYQRVLAANPSPQSPAGHMALVFAYMKLLDPSSVVRETEYANAQNATGVPDRIRNLYNSIIDGAILTPRQIADFRGQAKAIYEGSKTGALQVKSVYDQRASAQGLPASSVTYMIDDPQSVVGGVPPPAAAPTPMPRADAARAKVLPRTPTAPKVGERRTFGGGQVGEWDGSGWKPVTP